MTCRGNGARRGRSPYHALVSETERSALFPALLRHWRRARGLSQLDLSLAADVSTRHVSFLETGRAQPSRGMVIRLAATLDVPMRDTNDMLRAAGLEPAFATPGVEAVLGGPLGAALDRMLEQHEPFPMVVLDRRYDVVRANRGAQQLIARIVAEPASLKTPINAFHLLFDPRLGRPFVEDWETLAAQLLLRLHREALHDPRNDALRELQEELRAFVGDDLANVDLGQPSEPIFRLKLRREDLRLAFFGTVTIFSAPQNVTVEELRIESYFPADDATEAACRAVVA